MFRKIAAAAAAAVAIAAALAAGPPALAATSPAAGAAATGPLTAAQDRAWVAGQVRGLLRYNPGARQISPDSVRYQGAIIGVTAPSDAPQSASEQCPNNWLCLFQNVNFNLGPAPGVGYYGDWIKFYDCDVNYNLFHYYLSNGGTSWANQASSIDYPGSADGHEAKFNHDGDWWLYLYRDHYLKNLVLDGGPNPHGDSNDWITGLYVC